MCTENFNSLIDRVASPYGSWWHHLGPQRKFVPKPKRHVGAAGLVPLNIPNEKSTNVECAWKNRARCYETRQLSAYSIHVFDCVCVL